MTPLQKIKDGIIKNDMVMVVDGYNDMTGEKLKPYEDDVGSVNVFEIIEDIKSVVDKYEKMSKLAKVNPQEVIEENVNKEEPIRKKSKPKRKKSTGKKTTKKAKSKKKKSANKSDDKQDKVEKSEDAVDGEKVVSTYGEIEVGENPLGVKKLRTITSEFNEAERKESEEIAKRSSIKSRARSEYKTGKCEECGKETDETCYSDGKTKYICPKCLLSKAKSSR